MTVVVTAYLDRILVLLYSLEEGILSLSYVVAGKMEESRILEYK
jgi:hypothetical protein